MLKIKIGITTRDDGSIWSNGLDQNIYFLYKMLEDMGHSPTLVSETQKSNMLVDLPVVKLNLKNIDNFDLILEVAHPISEKLTNYFNSRGKPLVSIKYGNSFMIDLERYIDKNTDSQKVSQSTGVNIPFRNREIWVSEQFFKFKDYIEMLTRSTVKIIPYIWDSSILRMNDDNFHMQPMKVANGGFSKIAIVEPNLNVLKNCMVPLAICDMAYDKNPDLIKEVYCFNSSNLSSNNVFMRYIEHLNIHKKKISSYEGRIPIFKIFKNNIANTIVSNQFFNEQNYVYLETLFYKRLLVHNSPLFKEVGVYYPEFDVNEGSDKLLYAIKHFDQTEAMESYEQKLFDVSIYNEEVQRKTNDLIQGVLKWKI